MTAMVSFFRYRWLFYINPNYYGFSASAYLLLENFSTGCEGSEFECYTSSGMYTLTQFSFHDINPYFHVLVRSIIIQKGPQLLEISSIFGHLSLIYLMRFIAWYFGQPLAIISLFILILL